LNYYFNLQQKGNYQTLVCGEHGASAVYIKSKSFVDQKWIGSQTDSPTEAIVLDQMYQSANVIKKTQGATYYAVASCAQIIMKALYLDSNIVIPASIITNDKTENILKCKSIAISLPCIINKSGAKWHGQLIFQQNEIELLQHSANIIEKLIYPFNSDSFNLSVFNL
jgi:L-lactate dehydrogenase